MDSQNVFNSTQILIPDPNEGRIQTIARDKAWKDNGWISAYILFTFFVFTYLFLQSRHIIKNLVQEFFSTRESRFRSEVKSQTLDEQRGFLLTMGFFIEGLIVTFIINTDNFLNLSLVSEWILATSIFVAYYFIQVIIIKSLSYIFLNRLASSLFTRFLINTLILRSLVYFVLMTLLFYSNFPVKYIILLFVLIYIISKMLFLSHSFNKFFTSKHQILYVVLYLCALEIAPLWLLYKGLFLNSFVQLKLL